MIFRFNGYSIYFIDHRLLFNSQNYSVVPITGVLVHHDVATRAVYENGSCRSPVINYFFPTISITVVVVRVAGICSITASTC